MSAVDQGWADLPVTPEHAEVLSRAAITPAVAGAVGIRSASTVEDLPEHARWAGPRALPAIVFPWRSPEGEVVEEVRPDELVITDNDPEGIKYLWPRGQALILSEVRAAPDSTTVLLVEGTKQQLAAASYAPDVAVYGMHGCRGWMSDGVPVPDLLVVADRDVVVAFDADVAHNLDVWTAADKFKSAAEMFGARSVRYLMLPAAGRTGLDDLLAKMPERARPALLAKLIEKATAKLPAKPKPTKKARTSPALPVITGRQQIRVDGDRLEVINNLTAALLDRWNMRRLFCHGEVLSQLSRGTESQAPEMKPVAKGAFLDVIQETAVTVRQRGEDPEDVDYGWPDGQTVDAVLSRADRFATLDRVARAPFVRRDGSICQANGYDEASRTMVVMDEALAGIEVPDEPSAEQVAMARKLIMDEWLGDLVGDLDGDASRANLLALLLTPLVRGLVTVVPLAVIDGLQMGVGKNLVADCLSILATGETADPLPFHSDDDEENRKVITSAFRTGADLFVFDEAHIIRGNALARALTSARYKDRQLGVSQMLGFPNRVTWVALGNRVRVEGDIVRRVYRVALMPTTPNPQDRPESGFRHPDLRSWTRANRAELLAAGLTLVRAWFAAGCPKSSRGVTFGSFEEWDRVVGGIVEHAGQEGFLTNLVEWRSETSFEMGYWNAHVAWLRRTFGEQAFTCAEARAAMAADPQSEAPPGLTDYTGDPRQYSRSLGQAYAKHANRFFEGGLQLVKSEQGKHGHVAAWLVVAPRDGFVTPQPSHTPDDGGSGGNGGNRRPTRMQEKTSTDVGGAHDDTRFPRKGGACQVPPSPPVPPSAEKSQVTEAVPLGGETEGNGAVTPQPNDTPIEPVTPLRSDEALTESERPYEGVEQPSLFDEPEAPTPVYERVNLDEYCDPATAVLPPGAVAFDIETRSADELWTAGPDFIRLAGYQIDDEIRVTDKVPTVARILDEARVVVGHNIMSFDLPAFARHHGLDIHQMTRDRRVVDTMLVAALTDPPVPGKKVGQVVKDFSLDRLAEARFGVGKVADLAALVKEFGGNLKRTGTDGVPVDEARFVGYCAGDVDLTARLAMSNGRPTDYVWREHRVAAIASQMSANGFRVDVPELEQRVAAAVARRAELVAELTERLDLPRTKKDGKPVTSPQATEEGRAKIVAAFERLGVELPLTPTGKPALGADALKQVADEHADRPEVLALVEPVQALNGVRSVYDTAREYLRGDRVHPEVSMFQASGRWSITKPGLTVFGKRGGRHKEREIFVPEPGHVLFAADLSQVDARAVAAHCQDPNYLDLFEPGRDSHTEIAVAVWGDAGRRQDAKVLGHGWNYGMGLLKLSTAIGSEAVAREYDRAMRERYPGLVGWKREVVDQGGTGQLLDNGFGRLLRVDPQRAFTQAPALMGQSCARDLMMEGLLRLPVELLPYLRAVVHDEIVMSVPEEQAEEIKRAVLAALTFEWAPPGAARPVQIVADATPFGRSWGAVYEK